MNMGMLSKKEILNAGVLSDPVYYYYDDRNRLHRYCSFQLKSKPLLPDYLFEYDENDRVIQKITTTSGKNLGYLTWRYLFDEKGLKTKEACSTKTNSSRAG
jgi:hypothetical protein